MSKRDRPLLEVVNAPIEWLPRPAVLLALGCPTRHATDSLTIGLAGAIKID